MNRYGKRDGTLTTPDIHPEILERQATERGPDVRDGFVLFWGGWPSNTWPSRFRLGDVRYSCVEQWMHAEKARLFGDDRTLAAILASDAPLEMMDLGRQVAGFKASEWDARKRQVVLRGVTAKFEQVPTLRRNMLATGHARFVECSPVDPVWGVGLDQDDPDATDPMKWRGKNLLGDILTEVRDRLARR